MARIDIDDEKDNLRKLFLSRRRALSLSELQQRSDLIAVGVFTLAAFRRAKTVMCYASMRDEVQMKSVIQQSLTEGKRVCIPYISDFAGRMEAVEVRSMEQLVRGPFGILTVADRVPAFVPAEVIDLIFVPGVAFDRNGGRLGMGSGFYDRFLPRAEQAMVLGIAFSCQISERIPCMPYDCLMDYVVTEEEIINCKTGKM